MDLSDPRLWLEALVIVWNCALSIAVWLRKPGEDAAAAVGELREDHDRRLAELRDALTEVQTHMEHMPTSEETARLEGTVKQIDERTEGQSEAIAQIRTSLNRIETFLLNSKT